ncbi:MAG: hypothetical protein ACK42Z_07230 [Candidatus Kapaibacteriota bacterium]
MKIIKIILPIILLVVGLLIPLYLFCIIVFLYLTFLFFTERPVFFRLKSKHFVGFIGILIFVYPLFGEKKDFILPFNIGYDFNYLEMSIRMSLRAILLFGFSNLLFLNLSPKKLLIRLEGQDSQQFMDIAMSSYRLISNKAIEHLKNYKLSKPKVSMMFDFIANFMAEILSVDKQILHLDNSEV